MNQSPHWGTLCRESKAALYLMVILIPVSVVGLVAAAWDGKGAITSGNGPRAGEKRGSPVMQ